MNQKRKSGGACIEPSGVHQARVMGIETEGKFILAAESEPVRKRVATGAVAEMS